MIFCVSLPWLTAGCSATRGNIGLMCWSFSLFIVGLSILITVQSLLMWCSRLKNYPFSTPKLWEFFLGIGVYGACAAVVTAIALLVVTVLNLQFHVDGVPYQNENASPWDAHLVFDVSPRYAAIVAFSVRLSIPICFQTNTYYSLSPYSSLELVSLWPFWYFYYSQWPTPSNCSCGAAVLSVAESIASRLMS